MCVCVCVFVCCGVSLWGGGGNWPCFFFNLSCMQTSLFFKICPLFFLLFPRFLNIFLGMVFIIMNYPALIIIFIDNNSIIISDKT